MRLLKRYFLKEKFLNKQLTITHKKEPSRVYGYRQYIQNTYDNTKLQWLYYALLTGDKSLMSFDNKQLMQSLGLSHLLAISGLHIGLIFGFGYISTRFLFKRVSYVGEQTSNLSIIYSLVGFVTAFIYVYLSDFLVSATRALVMLGCYLLLYFLAKQPLRWRSILFALVVVLIINPFNVLNPGLYFSFLAVAIIFLVVNYIPVLNTLFVNKIFVLIIIQLALFIGLMPLSLYFFNGISLAGLLLNLIAIPLLSFIVMPMLILITLASSVFDMSVLIWILDNILGYLFNLLVLIPEYLSWISAEKIDSSLVIFLYITVLIFYLLPYRWIAFIPLSTLFINYLLTEKPQWQLHVFDVGHGLMILVEKDKYALIYDFGPSYFNRFSRTRSILLPYIKANNLIVKTAILSHDDNDHAGGLQHFIDAGFGEALLQFHPKNTHNVCEVIDIDFAGLKVESFSTKGFGNENDDSCVVRVSDNTHSVLLTGDISKAREASLLADNKSLKSTVMLSPHHGSDTSSSVNFINNVAPQVVIHSSAYKGQWEFPKPLVVERYNQINAQQFTTGVEGQISIKFYANNLAIETARGQESYWFIKD
ncbi:competence protein ComEC [Pseudoalteromonas sp. BSi20652]|nr:competence protein ComEC [Pseudoalteromonas sp. BSi20652]